MSKKRKRRSGPRKAAGAAARPSGAERGRRAPAAPRPRQEPRRTGLFSGLAVSSPFPTIRETLLKGLFVVAGTPSLLVGSFLVVFGVWLVTVYGGLELPPVTMIHVLAIPPLTTNFDIAVGPALLGTGFDAMLVTIAALVVRSLVLGVFVGIMVEVIESDEVTGGAVRRGARAIPTILAMNLVAFAIVALGEIIGAFLPAGSIVALLVGLYFLGFVPAAAVRERRQPFELLRRAARAARLPGATHLLFVTVYFVVWFASLILVPRSEGITANPSIATWAYVLLGTFVHLVFLAGLVYRWIEVEPLVPEQPVRRRR